MTVLLLHPVIGSCIFFYIYVTQLFFFVVFVGECVLACALRTNQLRLTEAPEKVEQQSNQTE